MKAEHTKTKAPEGVEAMDTRIAVVGMSAILPGGGSVFESWETIRNGLDCLKDIPGDRLDVTAYYKEPVGASKKTKDKIFTKRGGFIPEYEFNPREFGLNMFQMEDTDSNQVLTLLKVKEALEDARIEPFSQEKKNIGCVLGIGGGQKASHEFYSRLNYTVVEKVLQKCGFCDGDVQTVVEKFKAQFPEWRIDSFPGFLGNVTAGRCTNVFNLKGMNCVVDAACASSLVALKVAMDELLYGDCDVMVTGSTCTDNGVGMYMAFSQTPVFSTDQSVKAYDSETKGMLIGEGSVMLVLKRYADAVRDGDDIHGVVLSCASSSDGKASGIYAPTVGGQEDAINRAYAKANVPIDSISVVEGHGTGTTLGDRIELSALNNVFRKVYGPNESEQVAIGSIKSQIGHTKSVAGFAGILKMLLSLKHKTIPASINVKNPPILMDGSPLCESTLYINTQRRPWFTKPGVPRRCGISSFGFGGANYHCVIEEAEKEHVNRKPYRYNMVPQPVLIFASDKAKLVATLEKQLKVLKEAISTSANIDMNASYRLYREFLANFRLKGKVSESFARVGFLSTSAPQTTETLKLILEQLSKRNDISWELPGTGVCYRQYAVEGTADSSRVAALFSGQGSQYQNMFIEVATNWPELRESISKMDEIATRIKLNGDDTLLSHKIFPRKPYESEGSLDNSELTKTLYAQPATVACSLGVYDIFAKAGFVPGMVAGHSLGEFCALYAAKCINRDSVFELVCHRAKAMAGNVENGCMAAVIGTDASKITLQENNLVVANWNSPSQIVISGKEESLAKETLRLKKAGFRVIPLACEGAFHSKFMESAEKKFQNTLEKYKIGAANSDVKFFENVSGDYTVQPDLTRHMTNPVRFSQQVENLYRNGVRVFVEFGPKQTLSKLAQEVLAKQRAENGVYFVAINPTSKKDSDIQLRQAAVQLSVLGVPLDGFDPYQLSDMSQMKIYKRPKTSLKLSAPTFVSEKTLKERENSLRLDKPLSCLQGVDSKTNSLVESAELKKSKEAAEQARRESVSLREEVKQLKEKLLAAEKQAAEAPSSDVSLKKLLAKHYAIIEGLQSEYQSYAGQLSSSRPSSLLDINKSLISHAKSVETKPKDIKIPMSQNISVIGKSLTTELLRVLAEKTGYTTDMIELDMDLEADLGVDSIRRVEILSDVQDRLGIEAKDIDALSRTRTVGDIVFQFEKELGSSSSREINFLGSETGESSGSSTATASCLTLDSPNECDSACAIYRILAEKTGYSEDMIAEDMDLETDLGIDSIRRVEILSEVQDALRIEAVDVDALSRCRTVGDVMQQISLELGNSPDSASSHDMHPTLPSSQLKKNSFDVDYENTVLEVLAEKTGYTVDMIESDMDLETDLGVDSIRRVEILSEVQDKLNIEAKDIDALSRTRTVGEVIEQIRKEMASIVSTAANLSVEDPVVKTETTAAPVDSASDPSNAVLEVLAEKTGYTVDMIEFDMDLEADLGVDSIRRVEILSEVQDKLNVEAKDIDALSRTRTVGDVIEQIRKEMGSNISTAAKLSVEEPVVKSFSTVAPVYSSNDPSNAVLEVLAEKTGYTVDMIEFDMDLEADLGVDSIRRVEILSEVQDKLNVEAKDIDALSRTRTVGDVIEQIRKEMGSNISTAAKLSVKEPVVKTESTAAPVDSSNDPSNAVLEVLAEKTGYTVDMIEFDMDLEADLGVDSIRRVEILSEVQDKLNVEAKDIDALSRTRTVGDVIEQIRKEMASIVSTAANLSVKEPVVKTETTAAPVDSASDPSNAVLEVLAEKTGYTVDMIEFDMDLEADLGVDSIRRVEILSEVQDKLNVEAKDIDALSRTRTVGDVIEQIRKEMGSNISTAAKLSVKEPVVKPDTTVTSVDSSNDPSNAVLEVLAEKTGYTVDMIEFDMDLEADLGVDSIRRVEILSEVQDKLNVEAKDIDALSRTRTVGDVIEQIQKEMGSNISTAANLSVKEPVVKTEITAAPVDSSNDPSNAVLEVLAEKTGYTVDMIEFDMDLEADLGVDSIRRVEILSEVQDKLNVEAKDIDALSRTRTVGDVIEQIRKEMGSNISTAANLSIKEPVVETESTAAPVDSSNDPSNAVLEVLAEKTGYTVDMIEFDMDLEADLGVDSIRRVEILSEVQDKLNIEAKDIDALSRTRTVGDVILQLKRETTLPLPQSCLPLAVDLKGDLEADLAGVKLVKVPLIDRLELNWPSNRPVVVVDDGTPLTSALVQGFPNAVRLKITNHSETSIASNLSAIEKRNGTIGGFVFQFTENTSNVSADLRSALMIAKHLKKSLNTPIVGGRTFFVGIVRSNGTLGIKPSRQSLNASLGKNLVSAQRGAIFGLCKCIDIEWPQVFARGIDLDTGINGKNAAEILFKELHCPDQYIREVGYCAGLVRSTLRSTKLVTEATPTVVDTDVFLVTGGARGITPLCIREIARAANGGTYVLCGRSALQDVPTWADGVLPGDSKTLKAKALNYMKEQQAATGVKVSLKAVNDLVSRTEGILEVRESLKSIRSAGGKAIYARCDVSNADALRKTLNDLSREHGIESFTGVIHAAGVLRDKLIESKIEEEFNVVYGTKVDGLVNILSSIDVTKLRHVVLFSSLAGFHGNRGQSDYSMANESLNKIGHFLSARYPKLNVKTFNFGPWSGGMVNETLEKHFRSMGVQIISRDEGSSAVQRCVMNCLTRQILVGNWRLPATKPNLKRFKVFRRLSLEENPFLESHVIQGKPILPMTVAVANMASLASKMYPGYFLQGVKNAQLFGGVAFSSGDLNCQLEFEEKGTEDGQLMIGASFGVVVDGRIKPAYTATVVLGEKRAAPIDKYDMSLISTCQFKEDDFYDGETLFHGKCLQGIESMGDIDKNEFIFRCHALDVSSIERGNLGVKDCEIVDALSMDLVPQAMLVYDHFANHGSSLPSKFESVKFHQKLPKGTDFLVSLKPHAGKKTLAKSSFDFKVILDDGTVCVSGEGSTVYSPNLKFRKP